MVNYILILLAVFCFTAQFAFTKLFEKSAEQTISTTLIMLIITNLTGALLCFCISGFKVLFSPVSVFWAVWMAIIMIPYYTIGIKILSLGSLAIYSMFMMLGGMLVPFFYGILFLNEPISTGKIAGTVLLTFFIILQAVSQGADNKKVKAKYLFFALCIAIFFINGFTGVIAKAHQISKGAVDEISFSVIYCSLSVIFNIVLLIFNFLKGYREKRLQVLSVLKSKPLFIMLLLSIVCYGGNLLHLKAASYVPASVQFPLVSGGVIVFSAITSAFIFRENISKKEWFSVVGAFISTVLFAF